ncbi:hypothetical protein J2Z22_003954 [Paenibacillus forsythiae]|uniref:Uncharacterized protein n=1 Tax=Paenibacillus forsythiae TaxID=365616 RepID=A0ABU3HC12_9BACL|nr:hypothetical protein [Paenibacillus forsythiae]
MLPMEELEDKKGYFVINVLIVLLIIVYLFHVVLSSNHYGMLSRNLNHDFSNVFYQNEDTTTLYLYYTDDGLANVVILYSILFVLTIVLLIASFAIRRSLSTLLLLLNYIMIFMIVVYPYFYFVNTNGDTLFLTSSHFLLLTSYLNDYSLYIFIPYYALLIGLTIYFIASKKMASRFKSFIKRT